MIQLALWGTGGNALRILKMLKPHVRIVALFDNDPTKQGTVIAGLPVYGPERRDVLASCDYILITLYPYAQDVYEQLTAQLQVEQGKILTLGISWDSVALAQNFRRIQELLTCEEDDEFLMHPDNFLMHRKMQWDRYTPSRSNGERRLVQADYTRYRTFELCADEILKNGNGELAHASVAEVGVFRGDFASLINGKFPQSTLYLFDTFDGFNLEEYEEEKKKEGVAAENINCFRDTSVELVLKKMPNAKQCNIRKGYFPGTAVGLESVRYSFVSIDVDLHESIYESLVYFYPRLVTGGYLFIHEYNHGQWPGVKKAVLRYEQEFGPLRKVPLADNNGTVVIVK